MIPARIKSLFQFIEFLHSNIDNFGQLNKVIAELHELNKERWSLKSHLSFQDKLREDEVNAEIKKKVDIIENEIAVPIKSKATELDVFDPNYPNTVWNRNYNDVVNLKENADRNDLTEVLQFTKKYLAFREAGNYTDYLFMGFIFGDLDKLIIGEIHNYFSGENITYALGVQGNSIGEALELIKKGYTTITVPFATQNTSTHQQTETSTYQGNNQTPSPPTPHECIGKGDIRQLPALKEIEAELRNRKTVREKLDYWVEAISKRVEEISGQRHDLESLTVLDEKEKSILEKVFGGVAYLVSPIKIPSYIHDEHFPNWWSNAEYTNWFIPLKSNWWFQKLVKDNKAEEHINSSLGADFIRGQLNQITNIESMADQLFANGEINIDNDYKDQLFRDMVEYLRIKGKYYQRKALPEIFTISVHPPLQAYARHVFYKDYLISKLHEIQTKEKKEFSVPQFVNTQPNNTNYKTKHYVLAYIFDCYAKGETLPIGQKGKLEKIGNDRIKPGKGNTFYKTFNTIIPKNFDLENTLLEIGGENWRESVLDLSDCPDKVDEYLKTKRL
ncbi:hypothetical protein GCM10023091_23630 [Ravibacter arvi]|uniref:Uncharacterized protein n=1 Tax=Ravibacter arvi TaxID=2051041 RepID=A0ABP8M068_9BACT